MIERCIMIFPEFDNMDIINELRRKYDPLESHVKPHITLVFPFDSEISTEELGRHIENSIKKIKRFELELHCVTPSAEGDNYLFLRVVEGESKLRELHDKLYTGILRRFLRDDITYQPHMTIGQFQSGAELHRELNIIGQIKDRFKTTVDKISVEIIDKSLDSIIESDHSLVQG